MIKKELFGKLPCGCEVYAYTLSNDSITSVCILNYGGILKNIWVKDKNGTPADVICGFDSIDGYLTSGGYQGALIGRSGMTGMAGGDHLHFSMLVHGIFVTPIEWWDQHWIDINIKDAQNGR